MTEQMENAFEQWLRGSRYTDDAQTITKIAQRVHENLDKLGGIVAAASFERAYLELLAEKAIRPFRGTVEQHVAAEAPAIPPEVVAWIENPRTSAFDMNRLYQSDPTFRKQYDLWEKTKGPNREQQPGTVSLTAAEYHQIPAAQIAARYQRDRFFKAAVDKLIAEGKI
jgi:hypothetical protein